MHLTQVIQLNIQLFHLLLDISHDDRLPCVVDTRQLTLLSMLQVVAILMVSLYH